jgi:hypothetical protein
VRTQTDTFDSVQTFLNWDFGRLEHDLAVLTQLPDDTDPVVAQRTFRHFDRGLQRHLKMKGKAIFQFYAFERTGEARAPSGALEAELELVAHIIDEMTRALEARDLPRFRARAVELRQGLETGPGSKICEIYPAVDGLFGPKEAALLVERLQS